MPMTSVCPGCAHEQACGHADVQACAMRDPVEIAPLPPSAGEAADSATFAIKATMGKRWVGAFCSMLKRMEYDGNIGHSECVAMFSDGDGDFRPTFDIGVEFDETEPRRCDRRLSQVYDAG